MRCRFRFASGRRQRRNQENEIAVDRVAPFAGRRQNFSNSLANRDRLPEDERVTVVGPVPIGLDGRPSLLRRGVVPAYNVV